MKTKIFKTGLLIVAFLMAIGLAFATNKTSSQEDALIVGYIHENGLCVEKIVDCDPAGTSLCVRDGHQVYFNKINSTSCVNPMRTWR